MKEIEHGNCYNFDLPDDCLNEEETRDVINALMFDLRRTPVGTTFVLDISIGEPRNPTCHGKIFLPAGPNSNAPSTKEKAKVPETEAIDFLREHFDDILTLPKPPKPGLRRIK